MTTNPTPLAVTEHTPLILPPHWMEAASPEPGYLAIYRGRRGLVLFLTLAREQDGRRWLHLSMSHRDRLPSYEEMCEVKRVFVGPDRTAIQVFPKAEDHVSLHPFCLHLWACIDGNPVPDFTRHFDNGKKTI